MLKLGIDPEKLYRATFIRQFGLCCCNIALVSFRVFYKNLGHFWEFFGQMVYCLPWQKISRTPMQVSIFLEAHVTFCWRNLIKLIKQKKGKNASPTTQAGSSFSFAKGLIVEAL